MPTGGLAILTQPKTKYARAGDVSIAYQVVGDGPIDIVYVPGFVSHVELIWDSAPCGPPDRACGVVRAV